MRIPILLLTIVCPALTAVEAFQERDGLLVMECEHHDPGEREHWSAPGEHSDATGGTYLEWRHGDTSASRDRRGEAGVLTWSFRIDTPGDYRLSMRSWPADRTEHNDCWATFPDARFFKVKRGEAAGDLSGWIKIYNNNPDEWAWQTTTVDGDQHQVWVHFPTAGRYTYQVSSRSTRFAIDRIVLAHESVRHRDATDPAQPESPRGDGGGDRRITLQVSLDDPIEVVHLDSGESHPVAASGAVFDGLAADAVHRFAFQPSAVARLEPARWSADPGVARAMAWCAGGTAGSIGGTYPVE